MSRERILDAQAVEAAEYARKIGKVAVAAEFAAIALGYMSVPITSEEVEAISGDEEQRAVLACLARIHVDATKSLANRSTSPSEAAMRLEQASRSVVTIYKNQSFLTSLMDVTTDHLGREHHFLVEIVRDRSKALNAAAALMRGGEAEEVILAGENLLQKAYDWMSDVHPTKGLIGVEIELSRAARGAAISEQNLLQNFYYLVENDMGKNTHRAATVASWLMVWGEKLGMSETTRLARLVFAQAVEQHPEWSNMPEEERARLKKAAIRRLVFRVLAPLTVSFDRRKAIKTALR